VRQAIQTDATRDTIIPVLVLALDTTTRAGSIAVARGDEVLAVLEGDGTRTHGERLPGEIEEALRRAGVKPGALDLLVVSSGPGAFTGLRIGLAAMQGLAMVLDKPVVGVSALEALADAAYRESGLAIDLPVAPWMDAARGEVFAGVYRAGAHAPQPLLDPMVGLPADIMRALPLASDQAAAFIGDGAARYRGLIQDARPSARIIEPAPLIAVALARLGRERAGRGEAGPPHALQPLYVRRPDAELDRERHVKV
jgi:tRNA threonylcarbamoyladenosine biosynthesis protein TsaB